MAAQHKFTLPLEQMLRLVAVAQRLFQGRDRGPTFFVVLEDVDERLDQLVQYRLCVVGLGRLEREREVQTRV